jgi:osomolarity two-component system sensor histidine kinase SLN1
MRPAELQNRFSFDPRPSGGQYTPNRTILESADVRFVVPPTPIPGQIDRHNLHNASTYDQPFHLSSYPAALDAFSIMNGEVNNASSTLSSTNEQGYQVAVGYARPRSSLVDWILIVEQTHDEAWAPVIQLRNILLACVFGTIGLILLLVIPMAHFSVLPITRLKEATEKSVQPPGYTPEGSVIDAGVHSEDEENAYGESPSRRSRKSGFIVQMRHLGRGSRKKTRAEKHEDERRRVFKIPGKVQDRKHIITDELTELTGTFNEMSDELMTQYAKLEERVAERTRELEISKKAAEAANESKTLFIANISHELKTPLNGILGMCAVCMGEDDLPRIKRSLQVVYKSGDLLLHLLNDLLTFSKNQIGQSISIEEKEFALSDIKSQIVTIFDKQVKEGGINFAVNFVSTENSEFSPERSISPRKRLPAIGPAGTGRLKDMRLWGDQHRILQVLINLVSNSLKFTPKGGRVEVRIKCVGERDPSSDGSRNSITSKQSSQRHSRNRYRVGSGSNVSVSSRVHSNSSKAIGTALLINPMDPKAASSHIQVRERSTSPPPSSAKTLLFDFIVEDTGPGIAENLQGRVFEPFVQGDPGLSKKYGGTGLGLSICAQLAGLLGGTIDLESTEGAGSSFCMRIPLKFVSERASSTASSSMAGDSRAASINAPEGAARMSMDRSPPSSAMKSSQIVDFDKDAQPRLVGLSQPFFASTSASDGSPEEQLAALDRATANRPKTGKLRVLVAEDNLVNQEVVLR